MIDWQWRAWDELTPDELYEALKLRQDVFILEQQCVYPELDGLDCASLHLFGRDASGMLVAYLRLVPPRARFEEPSIGRVVTAASVRRSGVGKALMRQGLARADVLYPGRPFRIAAQQYLERFYSAFGFVTISDPYDEDGIIHVQMLRPAK